MQANRFLLGKLLDNAIRFEEASIAFYREAVSRVHHPEVRLLLDTLIDEERHHADRLTELKTRPDAALEMQREVVSVLPVEELATLDSEECVIPTGADMREVCEVAHRRELMAQTFYADLASQSQHDSLSGQLFTFLAIEEEKHILRVDDMYRHLFGAAPEY